MFLSDDIFPKSRSTSGDSGISSMAISMVLSLRELRPSAVLRRSAAPVLLMSLFSGRSLEYSSYST